MKTTNFMTNKQMKNIVYILLKKGVNHAMLEQKKHNKQHTKQKILDASTKLISEKGYNSTTLQQIANEAQVSEMTVIRHFQTKENILLESLKMINPNSPYVEQFIATKATFNLDNDLQKIVEIIQDSLIKNKPYIITLIREKEFSDKIDKILPVDLLNVLTDYFTIMKEKEKIQLQLQPEAIAFNLLSNLIGMLILRIRFDDDIFGVSNEKSIEDFIKIFAQGLKR
ncbi:TetR/AcrR family transcriptional regulator [Bacillus solimangrovi]|nr:TetR/AcrR family transcriptional regulator [Bacillus solimangrovi]